MRELMSSRPYDYSNIASCFIYDDILCQELHNMKAQIGDDIKITYSDGKMDRVFIRDIEYLNGTIWVDIIE